MSGSTSPAQSITVKTGYHGTSEENAQTALKSRLYPSETGYLGRGVYFYTGQEAINCGRWWANKRAKEGVLKRPLALISAQIELGCCLDYSSEEFQEQIPRLAKALKARGKSNFSDADVVELFAKSASVDTVIAIHRTEAVFLGSHFQTVTVYHLCVRTTEKILSLNHVVSWN